MILRAGKNYIIITRWRPGKPVLTQPSWTLKQSQFERHDIFPTKYVIPKSLSRLAIGQVRVVMGPL